MAPSKTVTVASKDVVPSINPEQTLKASKALLAHIKKAASQKTEESGKKNLLADPEDEANVAQSPVWLTLTTKRHIVDSARLKPGKIALPHPLNTDEESTICLITADPQRAYKDIIASEAFPDALRKRITRVVDLGKLKSKWKQYEAQRKLYSEHDVFLADDRIVNRLPKALGKTFYKTTAKRPIPVILSPKPARVDGKRVKQEKVAGASKTGTAQDIAAEIEKAVGSALVSLTPSTNTAIRIGYAGFTAEQIAENVEAVVKALVEKWVPQKWQNVKSIYVKGQETVALPIWLTDELWLEQKDIVADDSEEAKAIKEKANVGKKRKSIEAPAEGEMDEEKETKPVKKAKKAAAAPKALPESNDDKLDKKIAAERKEKLKKQKAKAKAAVDN